mmetsp:Transcript_19195/g.67746  ORF Transcript_19195/g.67746 Transcript_19195/m.67746 type:complete len:684 (-) Transcript_19195:115-2166(-)
MRFATFAAAAVVAALAAAAAATPAQAGNDTFYQQRWGKFFADLGRRAGVAAGDRVASPFSGPGFSHAWEQVLRADLNYNFRLQDGTYVGLMGGMTDWFSAFMADVDLRPEMAPCFNTAFTRYEAAQNASFDGAWTTSMTWEEWEVAYDKGDVKAVGAPVRTTQVGDVYDEEGNFLYHFEDDISLGSLALVDVSVGDWLTEGLLYGTRNMYSRTYTTAGGDPRTIQDVYFDPEHGMMNALTVGLLVTNNITITTRFSTGENATTHFPRAIDPYVIAYVQRPLPFDAPCPTAAPEATRAGAIKELPAALVEASADATAAVEPASCAGVTPVPSESAHYGWLHVPSAIHVLTATAVPGGRYVEGHFFHNTYWICRVGSAVGKLMLPAPLAAYRCVYAEGGASHTVTDGYDILVSGNDGAKGWTDPSTAPVPTSAVAAAAAGADGCAAIVGRATEDSDNVVPGTVAQTASGAVATYADDGDSKTATSKVEVLHDTGVCPQRDDHSEDAYTCVSPKRQPGPTCTHAVIIARPLGGAEAEHVGDAAAHAGAGAGATVRRADGVGACVNHQAFAFFEDTETWTLGLYGLSLKACAGSVACGVAALCNDKIEDYHFLLKKDLCADEPASFVGRNFTCTGLAAATNVVEANYNTCTNPLALQYELTLGAHNCHSYVEDVVAAYDKLGGDSMR